MKSLVWSIVFIASQAGHCLNLNRFQGQTDKPESPNIIGGELAELGEFPYQVSLQNKGIFGQHHICGGSIVNERYILTSASCIDSISTQNIRVIAGMTSLVADQDTKQERHAGTKIIHEGYMSATNDNDIALIKLAEDLVFNDAVNQIELPNGEGSMTSTCVMTGWGAITETGDSVDDLHKVDLPLVENLLCRTFYGEAAISNSMICAGKILGGAGSCNGDRGGPLKCDGFLHGIYSWSNGCAESSYPGVYTSVAHFTEWIEQYTSVV